MPFITQGKTNLKYILIIIIFAAIVGGGILGYQYWLVLKEEVKEPRAELLELETPEEKAKTQEEKAYLILDEINFELPESPQEYKIGGALFKIIRNPEEYFGITLEAYDKGQKIYTSETFAILDLLSFEYRNNKYILLTEFTGGLHCCDGLYVFNLDKDNNLKFITRFDLGDGNPFIWDIDHTLKNGKLYLIIPNEAFRWFYIHRLEGGGNISFSDYYLIEDDQLILSNSDFKEEYMEEAKRYEDELEKIYQELKSKGAKGVEEMIGFGAAAYLWFPELTGKTVNYLLAGEKDLAWKNFEENFNRFSAIDPRLLVAYDPSGISETTILDPKKVRLEIIEVMKELGY